MSHWNYRVCSKVYYSNEYTETYYQIYEVYYDDNGQITAVGKNPATPYGESAEELGSVINKMKLALDKPVLNYDNLFNRE